MKEFNGTAPIFQVYGGNHKMVHLGVEDKFGFRSQVDLASTDALEAAFSIIHAASHGDTQAAAVLKLLEDSGYYGEA